MISAISSAPASRMLLPAQICQDGIHLELRVKSVWQLGILGCCRYNLNGNFIYSRDELGVEYHLVVIGLLHMKRRPAVRNRRRGHPWEYSPIDHYVNLVWPCSVEYLR